MDLGAAAAFHGVVKASVPERAAGAVGELSAGIAVVEIQFATGSLRNRVQRVVMIAAVEAGEEDFTLVDGGVKLPVAVDVGIDDQVGRAGDVDFVVDDGDAEGSEELGVLDKHAGLVGLAVTIGIFKNDDAVAGGIFALMAAVVVSLGNPDPTIGIDVHIRRLAEEGRLGPD